MEKARLMHKLIHPGSGNNFKASSGWLQHFKERHGIRQLKLQGESLSADHEAVEPFRIKLNKLIEKEQLTLSQVFNCDETGLFWRVLPDKTLAAGHEKTAKNYKTSKDRVTVLATANATGDFRLPLLVIGKSRDPRAFKHIDRSTLPVVYASQAKAWMDQQLFRSWFF